MTTTDIICTECNTNPRLKRLNKNNGTCVGCDCDGVKYSMDMVPYEYTIHDLPETWVEAGDDESSSESPEFITISGHTAVKGPSFGHGDE